jgi:hypothetical protein
LVIPAKAGIQEHGQYPDTDLSIRG